MKIGTILLGFATAMIAFPGAQAADDLIPAAQSSHDWTGFYIGGQIGGAWSDGTLTFFDSGPPPPVNNMSDSGFAGGGRVGYDFQVDQWVLGAVADINATDLSDSNVIPFANNSYDVDYVGSVRGRVGYLVSDSFLAYATGGWAYASVDYTNQFLNWPTQTISTTMDGYIVGAGVEWAATDMVSAFTEYTYADYGSNTTASTPVFAAHRFELDAHQVVLGLSIRFK